MAPRPVVDESCLNAIMPAQGLTTGDVEHLFAMPDHLDPFSLPGPNAPRVVLYMRRIRGEYPSFLVGLTVQFPKWPKARLMDLYRVPVNWVRDDPTPKQVLEAVLGECGLMCQVGPRRAKLFFVETVPRSDNLQQVFAIVEPAKGDFVARQFLSPSDNQITVAVAYAIDIENLKKNLGLEE